MSKKKKTHDTSNIFIVENKEPQDDFDPKKVKVKKIPKTAQETIPFSEVYENGIFRQGERYTLIFSINHIDYKMMRDEEKDQLYVKYQTYLNALPPDIDYQEFIMNSSYDFDLLRKTLMPKQKAYPEIYEDYCNNQELLIDKTQNACNQILLGVLTFERKSKLDTPTILFKYFREIQNHLIGLGTSGKQLAPLETFKILHEVFHPFGDEEFLLPADYMRSDVSLKDYIVPAQFDFRSKANRAGKHIVMGMNYCRVLFVKRFSRECDDEFLYDLLDNSYKIIVSKHQRRIDKGETMEMLKQQMDDLQGKMEKRREVNHKHGGEFIPWRLREREKELNELQDRLSASNCDLFECGFFVYIAAKTIEELDDLTTYVKLKARNHQVTLDVLVMQQEDGLNSVLPFATNHFTGDLNACSYYLPTNEIANFIPFNYNNYFSEGGLSYGINMQTNSPIIIDRTEEMNANGFILGTSGSGKSMNTKDELIKAMMTYPNDEFLVIDPDNEFRPLKDKFDGEVVVLAPDSPTNINLFDTDLSFNEDGANAITMKSDFIMTFVETAKGIPLSSKERSVADRCIKLCYRDFVASDGDKSKLPTLKTYYDMLLAQLEPEAQDLALALELYVTGSFNSFSKPTNVQYNKKFIIFDIFQMGEQLRKVGLQVLLEIIWQRVIENKHRGVRTWLWCDEFSIMYSSGEKDTASGDFFAKVYKRIRKHGGVATGTTQNITEILDSKQATTMLSNAEFVILLQQKKKDLDKIIDIFELSESQYSYLKAGKDGVGTGLIICGNKVIPFENKIPKGSKIYSICSTKFKELQERKAI